MKIENLEVGMRLNWKTYCEILEIPYNNGANKAAQLKTLRQYCKVKEVGTREIIIQKILNKEEVKITNGQGKKGKYADLIGDILPYIESNAYRSLSSIARSMNINATKMYTDNRYDVFNKIKLIENVFLLDIKGYNTAEKENDIIKGYLSLVNDVYNRTYAINESIKSKLHSLEKDGVIELKEKTKIKFLSGTERIATQKEVAKIEIVEDEIQAIMGCNKNELFLQHRLDEFYTKVREVLEEKYEFLIERYYPVFKYKFLKTLRGRKLSNEGLTKKKERLKEVFVESLRAGITRENAQIRFIQRRLSRSILIRISDVIDQENQLLDILLLDYPLQNAKTEDDEVPF